MQNSEELMALAKTGGIELTKEEAEAYMAELAEVDLADEELKNVSGGFCPLQGVCIAKYTCPQKTSF